MIQLYWKNATAEVVGREHGLTEEDLDKGSAILEGVHSSVVQQCREGKCGYSALPGHKEYPAQVKELAKRYRGSVTDLVVLGIGGSALGNIALQTALNGATYNLQDDSRRGGPRLFVLDNVDPALVAETLELLRPRLKTTLFNVISKSGETAETAGQFMIVRDLLHKELGKGFGERIVATTDPRKGTLHDIAKADGYAMLPVPSDVGGRFSVLSPVGLFSAAMCGIDIDQLLAGAAAMKRRVEDPNWTSNPAAVLTMVHFVALRRGKCMHVMMPYSNRLYGLADWYRQLWAESLGKKVDLQGRVVHTGPTPIKALGATDQHSQAQLYREGPNDKLVIFLSVRKHPTDVRIPDVFGNVEGLSYLRNRSLGELLAAEKTATEFALAVSQRPSVTIEFDEITPHSVGEFFYLYEFTTSLAGGLLDINPYDQPAVELGKQATFALMGKTGQVAKDTAETLGRQSMSYAELRKEMQPFAKPDPKYVA